MHVHELTGAVADQRVRGRGRGLCLAGGNLVGPGRGCQYRSPPFYGPVGLSQACGSPWVIPFHLCHSMSLLGFRCGVGSGRHGEIAFHALDNQCTDNQSTCSGTIRGAEPSGGDVTRPHHPEFQAQLGLEAACLDSGPGLTSLPRTAS